MSSSSSRDRRTVLVGILVVGSILVVGRGLPQWRERVHAEREAAAELVVEAHRAERVTRQGSAAEDTLELWKERLIAAASTLLPGRGAAAGSMLAAAVSGAAAGAEVRLTSVQVMSPQGSGQIRAPLGSSVSAANSMARGAPRAFERIRVRAIATTDVHGLGQLLLALERGPMRLRVNEITVTQPDVAAGDDRPEQLSLELVVEGLAVAPRDSARVAASSEGR